MSAQQHILAIDLGTSGPKVALFTTAGSRLGWTFEPTPLTLLPDGGAEQNPADWWRAITIAAQRVMTETAIAPESVVGVACTAQWSGTVAVNGNGEPLLNAIIWMDSRGAPYVKQISGGRITIEGYGVRKLPYWLRLTGGIPGQSGKDPIAHILFIKHRHPEIYRQTYKFLEPKDYLNLKLTGSFAASYDSIALHWVTDNRDLTKVDYDGRLLAMATIEREKLPDLRRAVDVLGHVTPQAAAELGITPAAKVVLGTPDVHSAALGSGAVRDLQAHLYIGTSSWITCHVPFKKTDLLHNMASLPSAIPERYLIANEQETAGACLNFLKDNILFHPDELAVETDHENVYQLFDEIAARAPAGSGGIIFTPWLYGERTPVEDHAVRGGFYNVSLNTTREHFIRAVFEGVALNARWLLMYVEKFARREFRSINMIGGGAKSDIWCQIHADVLGRTVRQVADPILANVRGAAMLASVGLGYGSFESLAKKVSIARTYEPNFDHLELYDERFAVFREIYKRNRPIYARLNKKKG